MVVPNIWIVLAGIALLLATIVTNNPWALAAAILLAIILLADFYWRYWRWGK